MRQDTDLSTLPRIAAHLAAARLARGLSQAELALRCRLKRQQLNYFETGARRPSLPQLLKIARALDLPLERFLTGGNRPGRTTPGIAVELRSLGLIDLWVDRAIVPGAFRRAEEVIALAVSGKEPEPRIIEGIPAALAWNDWNSLVLRAFAREQGRATVYRLAWLAEIALALERAGGFPGGCAAQEQLRNFVDRAPKPPSTRWDHVGRAAEVPPASPLWKRWRISYGSSLDDFRQRAEALVSLAKAEGRNHPVLER